MARILLIGAGSAGQMILRDIVQTDRAYGKVVAIIDDNPNKWNRYLDGVPIVGGREEIFSTVEKYNVNKIYIAIPTASMQSKREIFSICKETGCEMKNLPGMYQFLNGEVSVNAMKEVNIEDLLERDEISVDMEGIFSFLCDKVILVSGAGGSIGSELCRQIAKHAPKQLILFDIYENTTHDVYLELKDKYPKLDLHVIIGSVRDSR